MSEAVPTWQVSPDYPQWQVRDEHGDMVADFYQRGCVGDDERAALAVACVNACLEINPRNPLAVAEHLKDLWDEFRIAAEALTRANCRDGCDEDCRRRGRLWDAMRAQR